MFHWQDFSRASRLLRRSPGFTSIAILTLGLGIGATTAIFSVVNGVLLRPLPLAGAADIVSIQTRWTDSGRLSPRVTGGDWDDLRQSATAFQSMSVYYGGDMGIQFGDKAEFTSTFFVNAAFFDVLAAAPDAGRYFSPDEAGRSAVVGRDFAQRHFGAPAAAVGRTLRFDGEAFEITGVAPLPRKWSLNGEVFLAAPDRPLNLNRTAFNYRAVARLREGASLEQAQTQLDTIARRLAAAHPAENARKSFAAVPLRDALTGGVREMLLVLLAAVALVLLIACANVANLLLARATARARELALRAALGASRHHIVRQLMAESLLLGLAGGLLGLLFASFGADALLSLAPTNLPRLNEVSVDGRVLAFASIASLAACLLFGLLPAWRASQTDLNECLKAGNARGLLGGGASCLKDTLVAAEIALAVLLVTGGGLLFRSFLAIENANLGFRPEALLVVEAHQPAATLPGYIRATEDFDRLSEDIRALPGVTATAGAMGLPMGRYGSNGGYIVEGAELPKDFSLLPQAGFRLTAPHYFQTLGIPLLQGRDFTPNDHYESEFVAIVNQSLARQSFPNQNPIGQRLQCGLDSPNWMTIVGVVGDTRQDSPGLPPGPELYMPLRQHPTRANEIHLAIRTAVPPESLQTAVSQLIRKQHPNMALSFTTMPALLSTAKAAPRFRTMLALAFAGLALLLAMAGVFAVVNYLVARRIPELGLRLALGAERITLARQVVLRSVRVALAGVLAGLALSAASGRLMESFLFGLPPLDPLTYTATAAALVIAAALAAAVPAWRAARVDPLVALRQE